MNIVSVCSNWSLNRFSYWKTAHMQLHAVSHSQLFCVLLFGVENGPFIGDWISINLFTFGLSAGWMPVRKYAGYQYCLSMSILNLWNQITNALQETWEKTILLDVLIYVSEA